ncbi:hypothetical protein FRC09_003613, partial [Ceratobasidium sp. 395]
SEGDARRPATKQLVESLRIKIQVLEAEVARLRGHEPAEETNSLGGTQLFVQGSSNLNQPQPTSVDGSADGKVLSDGSPMPSGSTASHTSSTEVPRASSPAWRSISVPATPFTATVMYKYIFQINTSLPPTEQSRDVQLSLMCDWKRHLPDLDGTFSRLEHDTILARCFKHGTSWLLGLVPEIFLHDMLYALTSQPTSPQSISQDRLQHYTPMLHCAILAFGCAFSDDSAIRSRETRDKFAAHAKQWLDEEIRQPVMGLVRSLALLAEYHCAVGQRENGFMYLGMSIRAARAMVSVGRPTPWTEPGTAAYSESITRDWHFWSTFAQDKLMSLDFGRHPDMPISLAGVSLPAIDSRMDSQSWPMSPADEGVAGGTQPKLISLVFFESCKLLVIGTRVLEATIPPAQNAQGDNLALNLHLQLETWFNNLPEGLLVWARSSSPLPHTIILHICYWWFLIHLHQPFYHRTQSSDVFSPSVNLSVKMCDRGAHKIVQLLNMFDDQYGLRFFPRNMLQASGACVLAINSCGNALLREFASSLGAAKKRATAHEGVEVCVRALRTASPTWPCAEALANDLEARLEEQRPRSYVSQLSNFCT